jgi:hypothetical protein
MASLIAVTIPCKQYHGIIQHHHSSTALRHKLALNQPNSLPNSSEKGIGEAEKKEHTVGPAIKDVPESAIAAQPPAQKPEQNK